MSFLSNITNLLLLILISRDAIEELASNSISFNDPVSFWWSQVLKVGFLWFTGNDESATGITLRLPTSLKNDSLSISLLLAGKMKKFIMSHKPKDNVVLKNLLDRAGYELWRSIEHFSDTRSTHVSLNTDSIQPKEHKENCTPQMIEAFQLMSCEWLLSTRVVLWEVNKSRASSRDTISGFRRDLCTLRYLVQMIPNAKSKLYLYEGSYRLICNSNPLTAASFFERTLRKRRQNETKVICITDGQKDPVSLSDNNDFASALSQMANHLPSQLMSCPAEREGYLSEANSIRITSNFSSSSSSSSVSPPVSASSASKKTDSRKEL